MSTCIMQNCIMQLDIMQDGKYRPIHARSDERETSEADMVELIITAVIALLFISILVWTDQLVRALDWFDRRFP